MLVVILGCVGHVDAIDVVCGVEGVDGPGIAELRVRPVQAPALEKHHRTIDATLSGGNDALPHAGEIDLVEDGQIELKLAVGRESGTRAYPWQWIEDDGNLGPRGALRLLEHPEAHKVVMVGLHEVEIFLIGERGTAG